MYLASRSELFADSKAICLSTVKLRTWHEYIEYLETKRLHSCTNLCIVLICGIRGYHANYGVPHDFRVSMGFPRDVK